MGRASSQLQKALAAGRLVVQSRVVGQQRLLVLVRDPNNPTKQKRVNVTIPAMHPTKPQSVNLLAYASIAAWRKSDSLKKAVAEGFLKVV